MKKIITMLLPVLLFILSINISFAVQSENLYINLESPSSPTNKDKFNLTFTTLDTLGRALTVKCFKVNPDNSEVQLGSDVSITAGGNSGECTLENSPLTENDKTYYFYAIASAGGESYRSDTVAVIYDNSGPGTPTDYSKDKQGTCNFKINFRASHDGNTNIIRIYRADVTKFIADAGSQVGQVGISPDQKGSFTDVNVPDCNKTYYYVVRAFDTSGNGSALIGDSVTVYTSTTNATTTTAGSSTTNGSTRGAIRLNGGNNIPKEGSPTIEGNPTGGQPADEGTTLGSILGSTKEAAQSFFNRYKIPLILSALALLGIIGYGIKNLGKKKR
jgi:hypothetical protein